MRRVTTALTALLAGFLGAMTSPPRAGEDLPDAVGAVTLGAEPVAGTWVEYVLRLPVDPLEAALAETADAPPVLPPPSAFPDFALPDRRIDYPVRLSVRAATPLTLTLELLTPGADEPASMVVPRSTSLTGAILEALAAPEAERVASARPARVAAAELRLFDRTLSVKTERFDAEENAVEIWTHADPPFGVCRLVTRDIELTLRGFGMGGAPPFPLPAPDLKAEAAESRTPDKKSPRRKPFRRGVGAMRGAGRESRVRDCPKTRCTSPGGVESANSHIFC